MFLVDIHTTGKYSGRRIVSDVRRKKKDVVKGKIIWHYRVTFPDGKTVSVDSVKIIKEFEKKP